MSEKKNEKPSSGAEVETVLAREAGRMGWFQWRALLLCPLAVMLSAFGTNEFIFTTGRLNTRCLIPECENPSQPLEFAPPWILNAVPAAGDTFDDCARFANTSVAGGDNGAGVCPAAWFNRDVTVSCDDYVFETTYTAVYDLGLACDEWRRSLVGSVRTLGALVSLLVTGFVSDRWGRRTALIIVTFNTGWMGLLRYFASNYVGYVISVFFESAFGAGAILTSAYVLLMETVPAQYRVRCGVVSNSGFAVGQVILGALAWALPYWRHLTLAIYAPQLACVVLYWFLSESVRWYLSKGRYDDAENTLRKMAKTNGTVIPESSYTELRQAAMAQNERAAMKSTEKEPWLIVLVFRYKPILLRCIVSPFWWVTMTLVYYGLTINAVNVAGNRYVNYMVVAAIEIPSFVVAMLLVQRVGRKPVLATAYWICAAGQIAYIFIPSTQYAASLTVYLISKFGIGMVVASLYLYTSEIYPTRYRQTLFSYSSMMGRIGSILAPLTPALGALVWDQLPFALFAGFALVSGCLVLLTPETRGCPLPDTMEEAANIGKKRPTSDDEQRSKL